jgi:TusA-related sulfurtransferase
MDRTDIDYRVVDARGKPCPGPLMEVIKAIKEERVGRVVAVLTSDPISTRDIPEWAKKAGHELVGVFQESDHWKILIRKRK